MRRLLALTVLLAACAERPEEIGEVTGRFPSPDGAHVVVRRDTSGGAWDSFHEVYVLEEAKRGRRKTILLRISGLKLRLHVSPPIFRHLVVADRGRARDFRRE